MQKLFIEKFYTVLTKERIFSCFPATIPNQNVLEISRNKTKICWEYRPR